MALIPPSFLDCVTAIGFRDEKNEIAFGATGFLFGKFVKPGTKAGENEYRIYLVTNRHVFEAQRNAVLRFNPPAGAPAKTYDVPLVDAKGQALWSVHPKPDVDAAAIPVNINLLQQEGIQFEFFRSDQNVLTRQVALAAGISEGDGVFVLGFPLGDVGKERNYVVVRHGIVARIRDALAQTSDLIVIDATEKGKSAVNTKLDHDTPAYKALIQKRSYTGDVTLFGRKYEANYAPLTGEDGRLTGALFVAVTK